VGITIPSKWTKAEAFDALDKLNVKWAEVRDVNQALDEWAEWADKDLGY